MGGLYLALGDSLTTGYGVGVEHSFVTLYYRRLLQAYPALKMINLGVNGQTSKSLSRQLNRGRMQPLIAESNLITITIGSNDLLKAGKRLVAGKPVNTQAVLGHLDRHLSTLSMTIRRINPVAEIKIATIYNPLSTAQGFNPQNEALKAEAQAILNQANSILSNCAASYRLRLIAVDRAFHGKEQLLLGPDQLHPNPLGHQVLADLFHSG